MQASGHFVPCIMCAYEILALKNKFLFLKFFLLPLFNMGLLIPCYIWSRSIFVFLISLYWSLFIDRSFCLQLGIYLLIFWWSIKDLLDLWFVVSNKLLCVSNLIHFDQFIQGLRIPFIFQGALEFFISLGWGLIFASRSHFWIWLVFFSNFVDLLYISFSYFCGFFSLLSLLVGWSLSSFGHFHENWWCCVVFI